MRQTWDDLLFAHWPLPATVLAPRIPAPLALDVFDGQAWLAITPFKISRLRLRGLPPLPGASAFPELNVRTYVRFGDKPGVFFFSLDAASSLAVFGARRFFHLPYFHARMNTELTGDTVHYVSKRLAGSDHRATLLSATYRPCGEACTRKSPLEHFLTERYCLYTVWREKLWRCEIHHLPWQLQPAEAEFTQNTMAQAAGIELPGTRSLLHFSKSLDVLIWRLKPVFSF